MILESIMSGGLAGIFGGVTGLIGGYLKNKHDLAIRKIDNEEKSRDRAHDLALMSKEAETAETMANIKLDESMFKADMSAMQASINDQGSSIPWSSTVMDKAGWFTANSLAIMIGFVTFVQKMVRPSLTGYLVILVHLLWRDMQLIMLKNNVVITAAQAIVITTRISDMIMYLASTSVSWWFATRPPKEKK